MTPDTRGLSAAAEEAALQLDELAREEHSRVESLPPRSTVKARFLQREAACLLGAAALRQTKTCETCARGDRDRNGIFCLRWEQYVPHNDGCLVGWTPKAPPVAEGETR